MNLQNEDGKMMRIGVLDIQGSVIEHLNMLNLISGVEGIRVKYKEQLDEIDGLIIPGGESTAIIRMLRAFGLKDALKERIEKGLHVWGTCEGLISFKRWQ